MQRLKRFAMHLWKPISSLPPFTFASCSYCIWYLNRILPYWVFSLHRKTMHTPNYNRPFVRTWGKHEASFISTPSSLWCHWKWNIIRLNIIENLVAFYTCTRVLSDFLVTRDSLQSAGAINCPQSKWVCIIIAVSYSLKCILRCKWAEAHPINLLKLKALRNRWNTVKPISVPLKRSLCNMTIWRDWGTRESSIIGESYEKQWLLARISWQCCGKRAIVTEETETSNFTIAVTHRCAWHRYNTSHPSTFQRFA